MARWLIAVLLTGVAAPGAAEPLPRGPGTTLPAVPPRAAHSPAGHSPAAEYRFDALRIDGTVRGPLAMLVPGATRAKHGSLLRLQRSFVSRIFETVEAPALHRGR
jgi:hypothetical protein